MATRAFPAAFYRGGSSKGLFFRAADLPADPNERDAVLLRALGSPDAYQRQLDGMGGGLSSVSKAVIVGSGSDGRVDYTFAQVSVDKPVVDYAANCGNLSSAVLPFALYAGITSAGPDGRQRFEMWNRNSAKRVDATLAYPL